MPRSRRAPLLHTLDCETDPFHHCADTNCKRCAGLGRVPKPFIWGLYSGVSDEYQEFVDVERLVAVLERLGGTVYAHNGGRFDYHYLRDYINSDEPISVINGRLAKFRIGRTEFRDSLNLFPNTRLADFNDEYGKKLEIDYEKLEPENRTEPNNAAEISRYLRQDCYRLYEVVKRYYDEYGKSLTQASSSMKYFERMYEIEAPRQTKAQYDRYRPFYYGGRVQCFEQGVSATRFSVADINSAYPFAMLRDHAFSPAAVLENHLPPEPQIYRCLISLDCTSRGAFPWRDPEGELFFPDDEAGHRARTRSYTVTGWEFLCALELDAIKNIHIKEVHRFTKGMDFKRYIEHHYNRREECRKRGDVAGRIFGKYFMNSLYGKFGANCENYNEYVIATDESFVDWQGKGFREYKPWGARFLMVRSPTEEQLNDLTSRKWRYYNVATAASVTGFVRAYLFRSLSRCAGVIYCDTDSIAAREISGLSFGDNLGEWKREGDFNSYAIAGKKMYSFFGHDGTETKVACKGADLTAEEITRIAQGEEVNYRPEVPTYSVTRDVPRFINRKINRTAKNIALAPEFDL